MPEYNEIPDHIVVAIMIDKFHTYEFTKTEKFFAFIGSPEFSTTGNLACVSCGLVICGTSLQNYVRTKNRVTRILYGTSALCSTSAIVAGTFKACTSAAGLSYVAIGGDFFGGGFLYLANQSKKYADYLEGKKKNSLNIFQPRTYIRKPIKGSYHYKEGVGFITSPNGQV